MILKKEKNTDLKAHVYFCVTSFKKKKFVVVLTLLVTVIMYFIKCEKILSQQKKQNTLSLFHGPTELVLTGRGGVIVLEREQGETSVCVYVQASVRPSSSSSPPSFCVDGLCAEGMAGQRTIVTEDQAVAPSPY